MWLFWNPEKFVIIQNADWIQIKNIGMKTKVFFSPNENSQVDFNAQQKYLHDKRADGVYNGYVSKIFGEFCLFIVINIGKIVSTFNCIRIIFINLINLKVILLLRKNTPRRNDQCIQFHTGIQCER